MPYDRPPPALRNPGMGLFTDAYDLFCIIIVTKLIGRIYYDKDDRKPGVMLPVVFSAMIGIPLLGTVVGQLLFGWLGDKFGRRRVHGVVLVLIIFSSVGSKSELLCSRK